jgi:ribonucleoside-diphosphate reductase alpha chain
VQNIPGIPQNIKDLYKTVWEIKQKTIIDMAADRGAFICQSQSLNIHIQDANFGKLTSMHFHAWKRGLKTGMYYLRTKAASDAVKFTVEKQAEAQLEPATELAPVERPLDYVQYAKDHAVPQPQPVPVPMETMVVSEEEQAYIAMQCSLDDPENCEACGS